MGDIVTIKLNWVGSYHLKNDTFHVRRTRRGVLVTADIESEGIEVEALLRPEDAIALAIELILCARAHHKSRKATIHANQNPGT
jgi:hypothetical protein